MKKTLSLILCAATLLCVFVAPGTYAAEENLARGCKTYACHEESSSLTSANAVDGNASTRFAAGGSCTDRTRFGLDLGATYDISKIVINWEAAYPTSSLIEISRDGESYTTLKENTTTSAGVQTISGLSGSGRYVRITEKARALSQYGFSIFELEVYGTKSAAQTDTDAFLLEIKNTGTAVVTSDKTGFITSGDTVTLSVSAPEGTKIDALYVNGENIAGELKNGKASFIMKEDTVVSMDYAAPAIGRFEAENCEILDANGNKISGSIVSASAASGGYYVGSTGLKSFVMENVSESNRVCAAYASTNTSFILVFISVDGKSFYSAGTLPFSTTNSWNVTNQGICYSDMIYFPEGCTVKLVPQKDIDLDYFFFTNDALGSRDNLDANTVPAVDAEMAGGKVQDDKMAYLGQSALLAETGDAIVIKSPCDGNVVNIKYKAGAGCELEISVNGKSAGTISLEDTELLRYVTSGLRTDGFKAGDEIRIALGKGSDISLDYAAFAQVAAEQTVTVANNPAAGERLTVSLDGVWGCGKADFGQWQVEKSLPEMTFANTIPVPGLCDSAAVSLGDTGASKLYFRKTVVLSEEPTGVVTLEIKRAQFGRYVYVNGTLADSYEYNYSNSFSDITKYLHKGENEIVIMLGTYTRQLGDKDCVAHVLVDGEKKQNLAGITDSVNLIFNAQPTVKTVKTAPDIENSTLRALINIENSGSTDITTDITVEIYELGVIKNGAAKGEKTLVASSVTKGVNVGAGAAYELDLEKLTVDGFTKDKCWTPDNPYLYSIVVKTSGDTKEVRFAMRTFYIDEQTKLPMLNGKIYYLFGTNCALNRFYEDPLRAQLPWTEYWVRKLYSEFKDTNWEVFRTHLGSAPELWYDLADELGIMIVDEFACWGNDGEDGCTKQTLLPEIYRWMDERCNHACVIVWDIQNEGIGGSMLTETAKTARAYDIQNRNWDNGWTEPQNDTDWVECHPYLYGGGFRISNLNGYPTAARLTSLDIGWYSPDMPNPKIINEYGSIWLDRLGDGTEGTIGTWNSWGFETREERLTYYAEAIAAVTEFWRSTRAYIGIMTFDGLIYSKPNQTGWTGDCLMPDISSAETLQIRPYTQLLYHNAFSKLGIVIGEYTETGKRGKEVKLPIYLINDTGESITDLPVTVKISTTEGKILVQYTKNMSVDVLTNGKDGISVLDFTVTTPTYCAENGSTLVVTAEYTRDGETIFSQRKWKIKGGDTTDTPTEYTLEFDTDGGSALAPQSLFANTSPKFYTPEKAGYTFLGWTDENGNIVDTTKYTIGEADATLTAKWEKTEDTTGTPTADTDAGTEPVQPGDNFGHKSKIIFIAAAAAAAVALIIGAVVIIRKKKNK